MVLVARPIAEQHTEGQVGALAALAARHDGRQAGELSAGHRSPPTEHVELVGDSARLAALDDQHLAVISWPSRPKQTLLYLTRIGREPTCVGYERTQRGGVRRKCSTRLKLASSPSRITLPA